MDDIIALMEKIQYFVSNNMISEAETLIEENPALLSNFPVLERLILNKKEIKLRDSIITSSQIVQNDINNVQARLERMNISEPVTGVSTDLGELESAIAGNTDTHANLRNFIEDKLSRLSGLPDDYYPEREFNRSEIGIHDSVVKDSTIIQNHIGQVKNYYVQIEISGVAPANIDGMKNFMKSFDHQLSMIKELYSKNNAIMKDILESARKNIGINILNEMKSSLQDRQRIIDEQKVKLENMVKDYARLESHIKDLKKRMSKFSDIDQSMFRGDIKRSGYYGSSEITKPEIKWKYRVGRYVISSPAVLGGLVYIGSEDRNLYALDIISGRPRWRYHTNSEILSSPAVAGGNVFFGSTDNAVYAVDIKTGNLKWKFVTGGPVYSSPVLYKGRVYFGSGDGNLYAIDSDSGNLVWHFSTGSCIYSSPSIYHDNIYFSNAAGVIYALNIISMNMLWNYSTGYEIQSSPAARYGNIYTANLKGNIFCIDAKSGNLKWKTKLNDRIYSSPAIKHELIFVGSWDRNFYGINSRNGHIVWSHHTKGAIVSSAAVAGKNLYFGSEDGFLYGLDYMSGRQIWSYDMGGDIISSPVVAGGYLYIAGGDGYLYSISNQ